MCIQRGKNILLFQLRQVALNPCFRVKSMLLLGAENAYNYLFRLVGVSIFKQPKIKLG